MIDRMPFHANALLSFTTGSLLALAPATVAGWLGVEIDGWLRVFGLVLLIHGALLVLVCRQDRFARWATLNVVAIAPYPILMIGLAATGLVDTGLGRALVLADGAAVGLLALAQWSSLRSAGEEAHPVPA